MSFFKELQRRNVVRVGVAYAVIGWVIAQIAEFAFENFGAPEWVLKSVVVILLLGLPLALFFAWAYELTPDGLKREKDVDRSRSVTTSTGRKLDFIIIGSLAVAVVYFAWDRQVHSPAVTTVAGVETADVAPAAGNRGGDRRSIAVLPFVNMSGDEDREWFSDGLTEEILNALARTPDLLVAARTSSFKYKNTVEDVPTIAEALGVAHVLEGSVRVDDDRLRVTAQLIRADDGFHLWSENYDRSPDDVIALQEEVAISIAEALETAMDPDALARMVSSGTSSVEAYNAYLQGLAFGVDTINTGDAYQFLSARDAFQRAVEIDPEYSFAYWELAQFWRVQLQTTNITAGIVDLPIAEMKRQFNEAIEKAIRTEEDAVNQIRYRALQALEQNRLQRALLLNTEYLGKRPNDQQAQEIQLNLLADLQLDDDLRTAIAAFQERDGYDLIVAQNSMTYALITDDPEFIRQFTYTALERIGDGAFGYYQAHRALLWAGDIDGASRLVRQLQSSDLPEDSRLLVSLRQACGEKRLDDAGRIYGELLRNHSDTTSIEWISHKIMGEEESALAALMPLDESNNLDALSDYLSYAYFDARPFPNLMATLIAEGIEPRVPRNIPYSCRST